MANLPMDIVNDVFLRLPATTLLRCRVLSKPCFSLIDSPDFVASHLKRTLKTEEHLMILLRSPRLLRTLYLDAPDKLSDVEHPLQTGGFTQVFGSVNGLIGLIRINLLLDVRVHFMFSYYYLRYRRGNGVLASNSLHWILPPSQGQTGSNTIIRFDLASDDLGVLSFPQDLYCEDGMDIGVLDGCLCLMCYSEFSHVDVWISREYQGEWSKFVTVPKPETVDSFKFLRPMIYSKDRSKILLKINHGKLFWFDLGSKSFEALSIKGCEGLQCNAEMVVSSLVLGCKGDPRRAQGNKMMHKGNNRCRV